MTEQTSSFSPELWGGIECTINRVGDRFQDQLQFSGHYERESDIVAFAELGIKKIRYPLLWERHQPKEGMPIDWTWAGKRLQLLQEHGIEPIAGLVHHGSGPTYTSLLDPKFGEKLAAYASEVAKAFPHIRYYTPVNEPLTTARFSGLYGLWYPHGRTNRVFLRTLINQVRGIILSMKAIRKVNPDAQLVQTEDLGKTYSTPKLKYQARFENHRRWLSYDLLCGKVNRKHKLYKFLLKHGVTERELAWIEQHPCVPQVFGFNYYVTSERYIDERTELFPAQTAGGNKRHRYSDVEAIRVPLEEPYGPEVLLKEAYERYGMPMALTEVHLHCHREDQVRWLDCIRDSVLRLTAEGIPIKAYTAWSLIGAYGWDKLLTSGKGTYEPGVFDARNGHLRPTALARRLKEISRGEPSSQSSLCGTGWWQCQDRFFPALQAATTLALPPNNAPMVMIIGRTGTLGQALAKTCRIRHLNYVLLDRKSCDLADPASIAAAIDKHQPWAVINAAGYVRVDDAESEPDACMRDNSFSAKYLAQACAQRGLPLCTFSSDLVFDGAKAAPYLEEDTANPLNEYGRSKALAEEWTLEAHPDALVIRTSAFFSPWDRYNFVHYVRQSLEGGERITVAGDVWISPTYVPDLANAVLDLLMDGEKGTWHLASKGAITWAGLARRVAQMFGLPQDHIIEVPQSELGQPAPRPLYTVLGSKRGEMLPPLDDALQRYQLLIETARLTAGSAVGEGISHTAV